MNPLWRLSCSVLQGLEVTLELWRAPGAKPSVTERTGPIALTMGARSYTTWGPASVVLGLWAGRGTPGGEARQGWQG